MNGQEIVSVSNGWTNTVKYNSHARVWQPAKPNAVVVVTPMAMCYPERPYGWHVRIAVDPLPNQPVRNVRDAAPPNVLFTTDLWNLPLKARIIAQGGCVTTYIYFDVRSSTYTWIAPFNSVTVQMLEAADPRFVATDIGPFSVNGQVSNYPSSSGTSGLTWTDFYVEDANPSIVMPYSVAFTYSYANDPAAAVPQQFRFVSAGGATVMTVPPNTRTAMPAGTTYFGPNTAGVTLTVVQHIDPSGAV